MTVEELVMKFYIHKGSGITAIISLFLTSIVFCDHPDRHRFSLLKVIKSSLCCLLVLGGFAGSIAAEPVSHPSGHTSSEHPGRDGKTESQQDYGIPLFRIDESRWFDITIDLPDHPETAQEIEEQRNRGALLRKSGRPETPTFFPDAYDLTEGIRLRFHYRFD